MRNEQLWGLWAALLVGACSATSDPQGGTESGTSAGASSTGEPGDGGSGTSDTAAVGSTSSDSTSSGSRGGSEGSGNDGDTGSSSSGEPVDPRPEVLLFRGGGGVVPMGDDWRFEMLAERLADSGRSLDEADQWPASLANVGLVLLPVNADPFAPQQIDDLRDMLDAGGTVIVHNEWSHYAETENLNVLLAALSSSLSFESGLHADASGGTIEVDEVGAHPLMMGVPSMRVAAGSAVVGCDDTTTLLQVDGVCYLAAEPHGPGLLLAFGDLNVLDDHSMSVATPQQNHLFLDNLITALPPAQ